MLQAHDLHQQNATDHSAIFVYSMDIVQKQTCKKGAVSQAEVDMSHCVCTCCTLILLHRWHVSRQAKADTRGIHWHYTCRTVSQVEVDTLHTVYILLHAAH